MNGLVSVNPRVLAGRSKLPLAAQPRFGGFLPWFEANPIADTLFKDVMGFNAPRIIVTRTWKERLDVATSEMANTAVTVLFTVLAAPLAQLISKKLVGVKSLKAATPQVKLAMLGASFAFYFPFAAAFWANPFIRNWLTVKRTGTANYQALVGLEKQDHRTEKRSPAEEMAYQMGMIQKVLGVGIGLGLASLLFFCGLARFKQFKALPPLLEKMAKSYNLEGDFSGFFKKLGASKKLDILPNQVPKGWATFIFWLAPAYFGWIQAARSNYEKKEWLLKMCNSFVWFSGLPELNKRLWLPQYTKKLKEYQKSLADFAESGSKKLEAPSYKAIEEKVSGPLKKELLKLKNRQYIAEFLMVIILLATTPQFLNLYLTKRRYARDQALEQAQRAQVPAPTLAPTPPGLMQTSPLPPPPQRVSSLSTQGLPAMGLPTVPLAASPFVYAAPPGGWAYAVSPSGAWQAPLPQGFQRPPQPMRLPVAQPGVPV